MGWSATPQFDDFLGELVLKDGADFQRAISPFLHVIEPGTISTPPLSSGDNAGVDFLRWSEESPLPFVVQAKGFRVPALELGSSQVAQCRKSIETFLRSGLRTRRYWLVHNRDGRRRDFREAVEKDLKRLVDDGCAEEAVVLDVRQFILRAFDAMSQHVRRAFDETRLTPLEPEEVFASQELVPLTDVPVAVSHVTVTQRGLVPNAERAMTLSDPAEMLADTSGSRFSLLLGEFGFGKTTTALRALRRYPSDVHPLFISAATIDTNTVGARDFLRQCINMERLLSGFPAEDRSILQKMAPPAIERILLDPKSNVVLIVDALDESAILSRYQGMQNFFNMLWATRVPIILTMRTEFWIQRIEDFSTFDGPRGSVRPETRRKKLWRLIELLPWQDLQIAELTSRRIGAERDSQARAALEDLKTQIVQGHYALLYGDIPRRPLFLRMILDSVSETGVRATSRSQLFVDWITAKIRRDRVEPMRLGGGRAPVMSNDESLNLIQQLVWAAMEIAAAKMVRISDRAVELLNDCRTEDVLQEDRRLSHITDPTGVFLHSLLQPVPSVEAGAPQRVRFAHRAFQEFFLSRYIAANPAKFADLILPDTVSEWLRELQASANTLR
jgi:hypothetical protein